MKWILSPSFFSFFLPSAAGHRVARWAISSPKTRFRAMFWSFGRYNLLMKMQRKPKFWVLGDIFSYPYVVKYVFGRNETSSGRYLGSSTWPPCCQPMMGGEKKRGKQQPGRICLPRRGGEDRGVVKEFVVPFFNLSLSRPHAI